MTYTRALLSVSDKRDIVQFARGLTELNIGLLSTGGTAQALINAQLPVTKVSQYTGAPEILDGRVKTLHPRIHGGILFQRDNPSHVAQAREQEIEPIDLVVVNLYPFEATVARGAPFEEIVENIDIGGPSMVRAAAKNFAHVGVVVDPDDYPAILEELKANGMLSDATRARLMRKAFAHTAAYDSAIAAWLAGESFPEVFTRAAYKKFDTRYGENPHQKAAFYRDSHEPAEPSVSFAEVLGGKELSYNNLLDLDSALVCLKEFDEPTCVIIKHNTPCGVASASTIEEAYRSAHATDKVSAFGGIVALNKPVDEKMAKALSEIFLEAILAPSFDEAARQVFSSKKNLRLLANPKLAQPRTSWRRGGYDIRAICGGLLVQDRDVRDLSPTDLKVVSKRAPTKEELESALFAWKVVKHVRSNAVVFARSSQTISIGGGQTSRVESVKLAVSKTALPISGSSLASDAFFPFRDGVDEALQAGATCIIQPGGSVRDAEVIAAVDERGAAMIFTGVRHFRH